MDVQGATSSAAQPATTTRSAINSDFDTFLKMMTTQLRNQDPLNPMSASDFAVQLATFSGVEQQVRTNELLTAMLSRLGTGAMSDMASWIGQEVRVAAPVRFDGSPVTVSPNPAATADSAELIVLDDLGNEIQRVPIPVTAAPVEWAGVTADGVPFPPGLYSFETASYSGDTLILQEATEVFARVTEVRSEAGAARLVLEGGSTVEVEAVSAIRAPA
ncbi:MAG: flagellar hook assembly protein FlgD [Rubellimicrobium sp.]|nr:flagellar hook assembly protein FlgD [Rubellimicrobium sp.]